jgi:hypothetical protein
MVTVWPETSVAIDEAESVSVVEQLGEQELGVKDAVTPEGRLVAEKVTV